MQIKKGRSFMVKLGDKEVEYNDKFKLILHTKLANPHYPPEVQAECTLINFMVTEDGLEDQLLAKVVTKERPDLEEEKTVLIQQQNEFTVKLKQLEDDLLRKLAEAQGDITEDVELIESLEDAKRTSTEIQEKVVIAKETEIVINQVCMCVRASVRMRVRACACVGAWVRGWVRACMRSCLSSLPSSTRPARITEASPIVLRSSSSRWASSSKYTAFITTPSPPSRPFSSSPLTWLERSTLATGSTCRI